MKVGTKSLLFGAHQFILHPIFVFIAWWKLYSFPKDPRLWVAFIVHDLGYWGKPNMDGKEGETHVEKGARIMHKLFDGKIDKTLDTSEKPLMTMPVITDEYEMPKSNTYFTNKNRSKYWYKFTLYHSRFYAKANSHPISKLCVADKYAFCIAPKWLYLLLVGWSGEVYEYMDVSRKRSGKEPLVNKVEWFDHVYKYMYDWTMEHKDNLNDTWTKTN